MYSLGLLEHSQQLISRKEQVREKVISNKMHGNVRNCAVTGESRREQKCLVMFTSHYIGKIFLPVP